MRSEHVFAAAKEISNRFLLCRMTSVSARRLHVGTKQPSETINESLLLIAAAELTERCSQGVTKVRSQLVPVVAPETS